MKKISILLMCLSVNNYIHAQETKTITQKISGLLSEHYTVLKNDKKVKNGDCYISDDSKHILAAGKYKDGKKDSIWNFMDMNGNIIQKYNYTEDKLIYKQESQDGLLQQSYDMSGADAAKESVEMPFEIGGSDLGFYLLYNQKNISTGALQITSDVKMTYQFELDTAGNVQSVHAIYKGPGIDITEEVNDLPSDYLKFKPAYVNGQPVKSKLMYTTDLNVNRSRQSKSYQAPTQDNTSKMKNGVNQ